MTMTVDDVLDELRKRAIMHQDVAIKLSEHSADPCLWVQVSMYSTFLSWIEESREQAKEGETC
jgi:hypothetical protein